MFLVIFQQSCAMKVTFVNLTYPVIGITYYIKTAQEESWSFQWNYLYDCISEQFTLKVMDNFWKKSNQLKN